VEKDGGEGIELGRVPVAKVESVALLGVDQFKHLGYQAGFQV